MRVRGKIKGSAEGAAMMVDADGRQIIATDSDQPLIVTGGDPAASNTNLTDSTAVVEISFATPTRSVIIKNVGDYDAEYSFDNGTWMLLESGAAIGDNWILDKLYLVGHSDLVTTTVQVISTQ